MSNPKDAVLDQLQKAHRVLIAMHATPDGDSAGSAIALGLALRRQGLMVDWVAWDLVPERLGFLPEQDAVRTWQDIQAETYDCVVAVDCGGPGRLGAPASFWGCQLPLVNIDHHSGNPEFGTINWVDSQVSSTGEMVAALFQEAGWGVTRDEALCLYTAISTDTLSFRQVNTTLDTLATVHWLVSESGLELAEANRLIWDLRPVREVRFLGWALGQVQVSRDGRFAWLGVPRQVMDEFGVDDSAVDTVVHHFLTIDSVEVAFLIKEAAQTGQVKISWRGKRPWNVAMIAASFGGGGHRYASAAQLEGSLEEAEALVLQALGSTVHG